MSNLTSVSYLIMQWTQEADLLLFKYLLKIHKISPDYKKLAEAMGNGVTPKAVTHRIARVRGMSAAAGGAGDDEKMMPSPVKKASASASAPSTKAKKEKTAAMPMTPKGRKGGKKRACEEDDNEDGGAAEKSPKSAKKVNGKLMEVGFELPGGV